jgi:hypothetical protein
MAALSKPKKERKFPMIQVTLDMKTQNKLLRILSKLFNISESFGEDHIITMKPHIFGLFMAEIAQIEDPPTLKALHVEMVDLLQLPHRTIIKYEGMPYSDYWIKS